MVISALASKIRSYDHPGTMKPPFFTTHAEARLRAQFVRGLASRAFQSFMAQMASAEHLVLPKGHALWRGAPSSTCLAREAYQVFQLADLDDNSTNSTILGSHLSHTKFWIGSLMMVIVASGASEMPDIFMLSLLHSTPRSISQTPQPCPEKVHQDVAKHMVISCRLTISKGMAGKSFFENVPSDSTVLRPYSTYSENGLNNNNLLCPEFM